MKEAGSKERNCGVLQSARRGCVPRLAGPGGDPRTASQGDEHGHHSLRWRCVSSRPWITELTECQAFSLVVLIGSPRKGVFAPLPPFGSGGDSLDGWRGAGGANSDEGTDHTARIPSPLPLHVAKTGRNNLNEKFTPLLPTVIGERF